MHHILFCILRIFDSIAKYMCQYLNSIAYRVLLCSQFPLRTLSFNLTVFSLSKTESSPSAIAR